MKLGQRREINPRLGVQAGKMMIYES